MHLVGNSSNHKLRDLCGMAKPQPAEHCFDLPILKGVSATGVTEV